MPLSVQEAERRRQSILADRSSWIDAWKEIRDYMLPHHGRFDGDNPNRGDKRDSLIIQNAAGFAIRTLSAGLLSGLTSPSRPWFRLGVPDQDMSEYRTVRSWLDEVEKRMYAVFAASNTYNALHRMYYELGGFGTACAFVHEDYEDVIRIRPYTIGEYALAQDANLRVDSVSRDVWMTADQMVKEFGESKCSENVRAKAKNMQGDAWFAVRHLLMPNPEYKPGRRDVSGKAYVSVYWEQGATGDGAGFLGVKGYEEFPVIAPRWNVVSSDVYGRGPAWESLADVKMLQVMREDSLKALDKMVDPPVIAPHGTRNDTLDLTPGGVNYLSVQDAQMGVKPIYQVTPAIDKLEMAIQQVVENVNKSFYVDMFLMLAQLDDKRMTATEVAERQREKLLMLGPVIEQQENEMLEPLIERTFAIMNRGGLIPEPPQEIMGAPLNVEYISILAQAQKATATSAIREWVTSVGEMAQVWPEARFKVNATEVADQYGELLGIPTKVINSDEDVEQSRQAEAQQMQMAQMAQMASQGATAARDLAGADMEGENALKALIGQGSTV